MSLLTLEIRWALSTHTSPTLECLNHRVLEQQANSSPGLQLAIDISNSQCYLLLMTLIVVSDIARRSLSSFHIWSTDRKRLTPTFCPEYCSTDHAIFSISVEEIPRSRGSWMGFVRGKTCRI
jgi:hypothetical protein